MQDKLKIFQYLKEIIGQKYYISSYYILFFMIVGMLFEILFLNNLVILLDLFTSNNDQESKSITLIKKLIGGENIELKVLAIFIASFFLKTISNIFVSWRQVTYLHDSNFMFLKIFLKTTEFTFNIFSEN